jgi:hypothetical protein
VTEYYWNSVEILTMLATTQIALSGTTLLLATADPLTLGLAILGSQLPDLDTSTSLIGPIWPDLLAGVELDRRPLCVSVSNPRRRLRTGSSAKMGVLVVAIVLLAIGLQFAGGGGLTTQVSQTLGLRYEAVRTYNMSAATHQVWRPYSFERGSCATLGQVLRETDQCRGGAIASKPSLKIGGFRVPARPCPSFDVFQALGMDYKTIALANFGVGEGDRLGVRC